MFDKLDCLSLKNFYVHRREVLLLNLFKPGFKSSILQEFSLIKVVDEVQSLLKTFRRRPLVSKIQLLFISTSVRVLCTSKAGRNIINTYLSISFTGYNFKLSVFAIRFRGAL